MMSNNYVGFLKKSRVRETPTLSTDADSRTDTNLMRKRLRFFFFLSLPAAVAQRAELVKKNLNIILLKFVC